MLHALLRRGLHDALEARILPKRVLGWRHWRLSPPPHHLANVVVIILSEAINGAQLILLEWLPAANQVLRRETNVAERVGRLLGRLPGHVPLDLDLLHPQLALGVAHRHRAARALHRRHLMAGGAKCSSQQKSFCARAARAGMPLAVDFEDSNLWIAAAAIVLQPTVWNIVSCAACDFFLVVQHDA